MHLPPHSLYKHARRNATEKFQIRPFRYPGYRFVFCIMSRLGDGWNFKLCYLMNCLCIVVSLAFSREIIPRTFLESWVYTDYEIFYGTILFFFFLFFVSILWFGNLLTLFIMFGDMMSTLFLCCLVYFNSMLSFRLWCEARRVMNLLFCFRL